MKTLARAVLAAIVLCISALCADVAVNAQPEKRVPVRVPCRAQYAPLTPYELVGMDECGHLWKVILPKALRPNPANPESAREDEKLMGQNDTDEPICVYWDLETGQFVKFKCPEPGAVTGEVELEPGRLQ